MVQASMDSDTKFEIIFWEKMMIKFSFYFSSVSSDSSTSLFLLDGLMGTNMIVI
jgi:hypothetical protein